MAGEGQVINHLGTAAAVLAALNGNATIALTAPVTTTQQITSTLATGTAPFVVASTTAVANLNASLLLGGTWAAPGSIGSGTPAAGAFTTVSASSNVEVSASTNGILETAVTNTSNGTGAFAAFRMRNDLGAACEFYFLLASSGASGSAIFGVTRASTVDLVTTGASAAGMKIGHATANSPIYFGSNNIEVARFTSGTLSSGSLAVKYTGANAISSAGGIVSTAATAGIGYATGAGGTVAQSTSKSTGVTLNTVCGTITLNAAALASATAVAFTFTNSAIAATDSIDIQHESVGTLGGYTICVTPASGSATVTVRNITAGSLSEALVLKFFLKKAVTA